MKAIVKGLIIGLIVIVIGAAILITALALNGWTFKKPEFVNQTFTATEDNTVIKIDVGAGGKNRILRRRQNTDRLSLGNGVHNGNQRGKRCFQL